MSDLKTLKVIVVSVILSVALTLVVLYGLVTRLGPSEFRELRLTETNVEQTAQAMQSVPDVVERTIPAVVSVVITAEVPIIERYFEEYRPFGGFGGSFSIPRQRQVGTEEREIGGGTGFFVSVDGYIITNKHVVDSEEVSYSILTNDGESFAVEVVARDPMLDIAVLRVTDTEVTEFPYLNFDRVGLRLGEPVIAIGNALAEFPNSVSVGVISGLARNIVAQSGFGQSEALEGVIQTDAAINPGNSGGPLLNLAGEVIGVNVAVAGGSENIGFALPATTVAEVYQSVVEFGEIVRPFLGIRYVQLTPETALENDVTTETGVLILPGDTIAEPAVVPGSPAAQAGLQAGDIILQINDIVLAGEQSLVSILRQFGAGETVTLVVLRAGERLETEATLRAMK